MIRVIIDNFGNRHNDLFLIIESPWHLKIADSYFLYSFLEVSDEAFAQLDLSDDEVLVYAIVELLDYWIDRIKSIKQGQSKFIPFSLSDQCVEGMMLEKVKKGFKIKLVSTDKLLGHDVGKSNIDKQIVEGNIVFQNSESTEWLVSEEGIFNGLEWSKRELGLRQNDA